jgi:DNA-directed RNA polymerase subunit K/omega
MQVFTPSEVTRHATNKYLSVLVAAKYARVLNEFPRDRSKSGEKKLTTRALEDLSHGEIEYRVVPRRRPRANRRRPAAAPFGNRSALACARSTADGSSSA